MSKRPIYIPFAGPSLLEAPLLNKGSAFTDQERQSFNLEGLLPCKIETIEEQKDRAYQQLQSASNNLDKHIYLRNIQDMNETLYFRLVTEHLEEIMPLIYTPTVGEACQSFSKIYRRKRGLFISYENRDRMDEILQNATKHNVKVIVVTDGERILGLGDQGLGGMGIPIGKLALYTACGGISPAYTLPITLDVGCNNKDVLEDPLYMGRRHDRITGDEYYAFIEQFIQAIKKRWPKALLQFEDFSQTHATPLLKKYRDRLCCFNDDIQGTASVTVGTLLAACAVKGEKLSEQTIVFGGAGSAGCGIASQIIEQMIAEGLSSEQASSRIFLMNSRGLLTEKTERLLDFQLKFVKTINALSNWTIDTDAKSVSFIDVVNNAKPTVLVGVSGQAGLFSEAIIKTMFEHCAKPIVLPLSNPTSRVEALPQDVLTWTSGQAIVATGSPFPPVKIGDKVIAIAQCNNSYIFPGVGLGVLAADAGKITDNMMLAASRSLASQSPLANNESNHLLPPLESIRSVSKKIALAVYKQAITDGVTEPVSDERILEKIQANFWEPDYRSYRRTAF